MVGHVACMEDMRNAYELLVSKTVGKQKVQIREFKETVCVCDWTQVANKRHQLPAALRFIRGTRI